MQQRHPGIAILQAGASGPPGPHADQRPEVENASGPGDVPMISAGFQSAMSRARPRSPRPRARRRTETAAFVSHRRAPRRIPRAPVTAQAPSLDEPRDVRPVHDDLQVQRVAARGLHRRPRQPCDLLMVAFQRRLVTMQDRQVSRSRATLEDPGAASSPRGELRRSPCSLASSPTEPDVRRRRCCQLGGR
jgi:hypothetical protein